MKNNIRHYMDYNTLQQVMFNEDITSKKEYLRWYEKYLPVNVAPKHPDHYFRRLGQWQGGWPAFLQNDNVFGQYYKNRNFCTFEEGLLWARSSGIKNCIEWQNKMTYIPPSIARRPDLFWSKLRDGVVHWISWRHWLGTGNKKTAYWVETKQIRSRKYFKA